MNTFDDLSHANSSARLALQVAPEFAFTPAAPEPFRRVFLSIIKCYWLAIIASLSATDRTEVGNRLNQIPPYGKRIPIFDGARCVEKPGELSDRVYEGLFRTVMYVLIGLVDKDVLRWWETMAEAAVMNWEED